MGLLDGFGVTLKKYVGSQTDSGRRITLEYPEETRPKPERFHGRHVLNRYEDGMEKCIGCELCAGVCPADCIYVRGKDNDPDDPTSPGERYGFVYEINYLRCIHCDLCVEACPTEAITETKLFEFAFSNRADAIYTRDELLVDDEGRPQQLPWENWSGGFDPAEATSGWMRATSPSGDAAFVDVVAWAGELGYGVRAPYGGGVVEPAPGPEPVVARQDGTFEIDGEPAEAAPAEPATAAPRATAATFDAPPEARIEPVEPVEARVEPATPAEFDAPASPGTGSADPTTSDAPSGSDDRERRAAGYFDAPDEPSVRPSRRRRRGTDPDRVVQEPGVVADPAAGEPAAEEPAADPMAETVLDPADLVPLDEPEAVSDELDAEAVPDAEGLGEPGPAADDSADDEPHAGFFDAPDEPEEPRRRGRFGKGPR